MAQQKITVEIQPTPALEQLLRRLIQESVDRKIQPDVADLEPVTARTPDGVRVLFIDDDGEPHWPLVTNMDVAVAKGWRQAFIKKMEKS